MADVSKQKKESELSKELTLLTYTVRQLIEAVKELSIEVKKTKVIQVPIITPAVPLPAPQASKRFR